MQNVTMTDQRKESYSYEESIKTLRTNIQFAGKGIQTILFTSCYPNEGKSDIAFQLAKEIGKMGKRVVLLDADIRKSSLISRYQVRENIKGLSQYLSGQADMSEICCHTNFENMDIIFAGLVAPNPSELLEEEDFAELIQALRMRYEYILVDTPPLGSVIDAAIVAKQCDGAVLIIESELVSYRVAQKMKAQLLRTGCRILGAVLNKVDEEKQGYYNRYYKGKYHKYYKYSYNNYYGNNHRKT